MRKIFAYFYSLLLLTCIGFSAIAPFFATEKVSAAGAYVQNYVSYGALIRNLTKPSELSSFTAVSSAFYKQGNNPDNYPSYVSGETQITKEKLCDSKNMYGNKSGIIDQICRYEKENAVSGKKIFNHPLAEIGIDKYGNVEINLDPGVELEYLHIKYVLYGITENLSVPTSMLYCKGDKLQICDSASTVKGTSWKDFHKNGLSMLARNDAEMDKMGFTIIEKDAGKKGYIGFNIIENMEKNNKEIAKEKGAFVTYDFRVTYNGKSHYINSGLESIKFTDLRKYSDTDSVTNSAIFPNISPSIEKDQYKGSYQTTANEYGGKLDSFTSLITYNANDKGPKDEGAKRFIKIMDTYIVPVIYSGLGLLLAVRGTMLAVKIIKSSDEPEVRHDAIKSLINIFIAVGVIFLIIYFYKDIYEIMKGIVLDE